MYLFRYGFTYLSNLFLATEKAFGRKYGRNSFMKLDTQFLLCNSRFLKNWTLDGATSQQ